ncbi:MAG: hypothetical protein JWP08_89 [Bryobacterales bacterium]|nr:hypothetical protein [Bryobacterales bacterium]
MSNSQSNLSEARPEANRRNAQRSTGPTSEAGKAASSRNAVKTALTGRAVLLPGDDADRYQAHVNGFLQELTPVGHQETLLTQSLADIAWRLERIASLEMAIYAGGRAQFESLYEEDSPGARHDLVELEIYIKFERQLRNFQIQEARLRRQREKDKNELRVLQSERRKKEREQLEAAARLYQQAKQEGRPVDLAAHGFVFEIHEIEFFLDRIHASESAARTPGKHRGHESLTTKAA